MNAPDRPAIRSYVLRAGRITQAQRHALERLLPRWGIPYSVQTLDFNSVFGRRARRVMEIGFGNGDTLVDLAAASPEADFLGIEVHPPGVGRCLLAIESRALTNLRLIAHDAVEVLANQLPPASLDEVLLYFPDPWPKKRHHKRRIVQPAFAGHVARALAQGGRFKLATDWEPYAEWMLEVLNAAPEFANAAPGNGCIERPDRGETRFEDRGKRLGHHVFDLEYIRR